MGATMADYNECKFMLPIVLAFHILISQIMLSDSAVSSVKKQPTQPNFLFPAVSDSRDSRAFLFSAVFFVG
jgi:hypothetical protein